MDELELTVRCDKKYIVNKEAPAVTHGQSDFHLDIVASSARVEEKQYVILQFYNFTKYKFDHTNCEESYSSIFK